MVKCEIRTKGVDAARNQFGQNNRAYQEVRSHGIVQRVCVHVIEEELKKKVK